MSPFSDPNITLLLLQGGCFSITFILALLLLMARILQQSTVGLSYETSRWLLFASLMLFALHYLLQMIFGFRAQGDDVGAIINILFYLPASFLLDCAMIRISTGSRYLRRFIVVGVSCFVLALILFAVGWSIYGSLHMPWILPLLGVIFVVQTLICIFYPGSELRRIESRIEDETADDITAYRLHMRSGTVLLYVMGLIGALSIYRTGALLVVAAFFLLALVFYVVCFLSLGFNISAVSSVVDDTKTPSETPADDLTMQITPDQALKIKARLEQWRLEHGYSVTTLNSYSMAQNLGITKRQLTQYLAENEGLTFRVWLSNIRIEEAKRMLLSDAQYNIEAIADACGFSSRSWMQAKFKASTGMTPNEWRDAQSQIH